MLSAKLIALYNLFERGISIIIQKYFMKQTLQCVWTVGKNP